MPQKAKGKAKADASVEEGHSASIMSAQGGACARTPGNEPPACAARRRARATQRPNRCAVSGPKDYGALDDQKSKEAYSRAVAQPPPPALAHQPSRFPRPPAFHAYRPLPGASTFQRAPRAHRSPSPHTLVLQGGAKLVDHPLYEKPKLRTKMRSILPRLLGLCCILVFVMVVSIAWFRVVSTV